MKLRLIVFLLARTRVGEMHESCQPSTMDPAASDPRPGASEKRRCENNRVIYVFGSRNSLSLTHLQQRYSDDELSRFWSNSKKKNFVVMKHLQEWEGILICPPTPLQPLEPERRHVGTRVFRRTKQRKLELLLLLLAAFLINLFFSNISGRVLLAVDAVVAGGAVRAAHGCRRCSVQMKRNVSKRLENSDFYIWN